MWTDAARERHKDDGRRTPSDLTDAEWRTIEPTTAILDSQSVTSGLHKGPRGVDDNKLVRGIKRHVLTCPLGFVPAALVTTANAHDTQPVGALLDRATQDGWSVKRAKVDGIHVGPCMAQAAAEHDLDVQVTTREAGVKGLPPLRLRWRIEATFGTLSNRWHRLTRNLEQSPAAAEEAVSIANCRRLLRAYHRTRYMVT